MKHFTDDQLVEEAKKYAKEERAITLKVIEALTEIEERKIYLQKKYDCANLFEFCRKELDYSKGTAGRRVAAVRLIDEVPEVKELHLEGSINMETIHKVQSKAKKEKYTPEQTKQVIEQVINKPEKQVDLILHPEKRYTIQLDEEEFALLRELKARMRTPNLKKALKEALKHLPIPKGEEKKDRPHTRYRQRSTEYEVLQRTQECIRENCTWKGDLQFGHWIDFSDGGKTIAENLVLQCPPHNRLHSIEKTKRYIMNPQVRPGPQSQKRKNAPAPQTPEQCSRSPQNHAPKPNEEPNTRTAH